MLQPDKSVKAEELIEEQLDAIRDDLRNFYINGNKAAGTRARVGLMKITHSAAAIRKDIQAIKSGELSTL